MWSENTEFQTKTRAATTRPHSLMWWNFRTAIEIWTGDTALLQPLFLTIILYAAYSVDRCTWNTTHYYRYPTSDKSIAVCNLCQSTKWEWGIFVASYKIADHLHTDSRTSRQGASAPEEYGESRPERKRLGNHLNTQVHEGFFLKKKIFKSHNSATRSNHPGLLLSYQNTFRGVFSLCMTSVSFSFLPEAIVKSRMPSIRLGKHTSTEKKDANIPTL